MRQEWDGIRDDLSSVGGSHLTTAAGVSFSVEGEIQRRAGLTWLVAQGGTMLAAFRSPVSGAWLLVADSSGNLKAVRLSDASVTTLATGLNAALAMNWSIQGPRIYFANDFDRIKVWDGVWSAARDAGIAGPGSTQPTSVTSTAAGTTTAGLHLIRVRFVDSLSPGGNYRSNPSAALSYTVTAGNEALTFSIGTLGAIGLSTDPKVDTIVLEATLVNGSVYFEVQRVPNATGSVVFNLSDTLLALQTASATYDDFGHEQPPIARVMFECRGYTFLCGSISRTITGTVTNGSPSVTGSGFSSMWGGRLIRFASETTTYSIGSSLPTAMIMNTTYAGSNGTYTATVYSQTPNRFYWSKNGYPESYEASVRARDALLGNGDVIVGGSDFIGDAWFFGQRSMARLVFVDDPAAGEMVAVPGFHGLWNQRCLVAVDGQLYGWGPNGAWVLTGGRARWISRPIDTTVNALIDRTYMDQAHAEYDPVAKSIRWQFVATGDTVPRYAMKLDLTKMRWSLDQYRFGIDASVVTADDNGRLRLACSDNTEGMTYFHEGATDGVPAASTGSYTANTGSTTTVIQVNESLPTGGAGTDLTKLKLYRPATGEERLISANTSSTITVSALASAPTVGEAITVGQIPFTISTPWWVGQGLDFKDEFHLHLEMRPGTSGTARVSVYRNFSASAHVFTQNDFDTWPDGVTISADGTYLSVALTTGVSTDGFVNLPMPAEWARAIRAQVTVVDPVGVPAILDVKFDIEAQSQEELRDTRE